MGTIKDKNGMDLTETEDTKRGCQEYTEKLYKKDLYYLNKYGDVITDLKPDILECEVKWALGSITTNKASGTYGILAQLFKILMMPLKSCTQYGSRFGKLSSDHRAEKGPFSFQSQRRIMQKNVQTKAQLCSFHMLAM